MKFLHISLSFCIASLKLNFHLHRNPSLFQMSASDCWADGNKPRTLCVVPLMSHQCVCTATWILTEQKSAKEWNAFASAWSLVMVPISEAEAGDTMNGGNCRWSCLPIRERKPPQWETVVDYTAKSLFSTLNVVTHGVNDDLCCSM